MLMLPGALALFAEEWNGVAIGLKIAVFVVWFAAACLLVWSTQRHESRVSDLAA